MRVERSHGRIPDPEVSSVWIADRTLPALLLLALAVVLVLFR